VRFLILTILIGLLFLTGFGCASETPIAPPQETENISISLTRLYPEQSSIEAVRVIVTRTDEEGKSLPGRKIQLAATSGEVGTPTDLGDGSYEALWTGKAIGEVTLTAVDVESDPQLQTSVTFLALEWLDREWDVPIKIGYPVSSDGWDTAPFLSPDGSKLIFAYITLDMASLAANIFRPIGQERPGQVIPQTLNIFIAEKPQTEKNWWWGWHVEHARCNLFEVEPTYFSAPSITMDSRMAFCTVQRYAGGGKYKPSVICSVDPEFSIKPSELGAPVDMPEYGEDNPYLAISSGWLYFDAYDLSDPLSKQDIWAARWLGGGSYDKPVRMPVGLNTDDIETQAFVYEPDNMMYFASDREQEEFQLGIWKVQVWGDQVTGVPQPVAKGPLAIGRPSISLDGNWFCFAYARAESGGANADIAIARKLK